MRRNTELLAAALLLAAAPACAAGRRPSVVLVVMDALRADRVPPYGGGAGLVPELRRFAAGADAYEKAYAGSIWTGASFATMLTGLRPHSHGLYGFRDALRGAPPTLQSLLGGAGYETAAFVAGLAGEPGYGFGRGFGVFDAAPAGATLAARAAAAGRWLDGVPQEKDFFLLVHGADIHAAGSCGGAAGPGPEPPAVDAEFLDYFNDLPGWDLAAIDPDRWRRVRKYRTDRAFLDRLARDYDRCVAGLDAGLGVLLRRLESRGGPQLVIVTADHGQLLGEHGRLGHVAGAYEQLLRVPLLVRFPGAAAGRRLPAPAGHVDLLPTVCAAAGLACPAADGRDLAAPPGGPRTLASAGGGGGPYGGPVNAAYYEGNWKLARNGAGWELFDLAADPGETRDLAAARPAEFLRLAAGYLDLAGAGRDGPSPPVAGENAGHCAPAPGPAIAAPAEEPCARARAGASRLAMGLDFDAAAAALRRACPAAVVRRDGETLALLRSSPAAAAALERALYTFSAEPGRWRLAGGGLELRYFPGKGLACEKNGVPSAGPGCARAAAALLDCAGKYGAVPAGGQDRADRIGEALRKAGYVR